MKPLSTQNESVLISPVNICESAGMDVDFLPANPLNA